MSKEKIIEFKVGERLDKELARLHPEYSRSAIEKLIENGDILVNNERKQTRYKLKQGDIILADFSYFELPTSKIELPILYEDENVVVINKPVGVLAHSKGTFNKEGTAASWLKEHVGVIPDSDRESSQTNRAQGTQNKLDYRSNDENDKPRNFWESNRAGIVHRLDRATSGVMILAKNEAAQSHLGKQFSSRKVKKTYIALVDGTPPETSGLIDIPIERNPKKPATFRAGVNGKPAQTNFKVLKIASSSLLELNPITGRTHQLRVHLSYLKCPIIGDEFYGGKQADRLFLHAKDLEITIPGSKRMTFTAPVPSEFEEYLS